MRNGSLKILWDLFKAKRELSEATLLSCYVQTTMELLSRDSTVQPSDLAQWLCVRLCT